MAISQKKYVDITSAVVGATAVPLQKLCGRVFTKNTVLQSLSAYEFRTANDVADFFGADSEEAKFAARYFSYVSPAPVSRAKEIQFVSLITGPRNARSVGLGKVLPLDELKQLSGTFLINGSTIDVAISDAESYAAVASKVSEAAADKLESFEYTEIGGKRAFVATAKEPDEKIVISGSIADAMGFDDAMESPKIQAESAVDVYRQSCEISDSFGSAYFLADNASDDDLVAIAELNASYNVKHQLYIDVNPDADSELIGRLGAIQSTGLLLKKKDGDTVAFLPMAIMAATDYDRTNATTNYMFRQAIGDVPAQVTSTRESDTLDRQFINYYGATAVAGSDIKFFQRGSLCGTASSPRDMSVHANEQWLKAYIAQQWFTLLISTRGIPANRDGEARALTVIGGAVSKALNNGTILPGKTFTDVQRIAIGDASGDPQAWRDVETKGYWYNAKVVEYTADTGFAEYKMQYTLIYGKGDWVRKVEGSHNLV